jgi:purine-binding chemotaxis protein CheW
VSSLKVKGVRDRNQFAKENVVEDYLSDLLTDCEENQDPLETTKKLLEKASEVLVEVESTVDIETQTAQQKEVTDDNKEIREQVDIKTTEENFAVVQESTKSLQDTLADRFQALFFEVAGLTLAVPLIELGGIHKVTSISSMPGKPDWFLGVMLKQDDKYNVVDSARWVMPEKCTPALLEALDYQFLINLGKTPWCMACEQLVDTVELNKSDVQWREQTGKRPWLAGMVKEKMCALINVSELVQMLQSGTARDG